MAYSKTILCLAASRKPDGTCIAGKELLGEQLGEWVRPISSRETESISGSDRRYQNGQLAKLLDKIQIRFVGHRPAGFQTENHLIDNDSNWRKVEIASWEDVETAVDEFDGPLWVDKNSTYHGHNDKILEADVAKLDTSLCLIRPDDLRLRVGPESKVFGGAEQVVRASFYHNGSAYKLKVTDPVIERTYLRKDDGTYRVQEAIVCVSLTKLFHGSAFKLAAAIITPKRVANANQ
jgi:hypothetical protein